MSAYLVVDVQITDPERMALYREWSTRAMQECGAKILARGGDIDVLEGPWHPKRMVILEFPDKQAAHDFYHCETYTHARTIREGAGVISMVVVNGV